MSAECTPSGSVGQCESAYERRGILHVRRHLAASPLFKGIPYFKETRIAMLRAETVKELFSILDYIRGNYGMNS